MMNRRGIHLLVACVCSMLSLAGAQVDEPTPAPTATDGPTMVLDLPMTTGVLDRSVILEIIERHREPLFACYTTELMDSPEAAGTVVLGFWIEVVGAVTHVTQEEVDPGLQGLADCLAVVLPTIQFPSTGKGGGINIVRLSLRFSPGGGDTER